MASAAGLGNYCRDEAWMSDEQSLNISLSVEHNFMHKKWSHQTAVKCGGAEKWIPEKINIKRRREFELANQRSFETLRLELVNPLAENVSLTSPIVHIKAWVTSF